MDVIKDEFKTRLKNGDLMSFNTALRLQQLVGFGRGFGTGHDLGMEHCFDIP
jgi:hypothetical protein